MGSRAVNTQDLGIPGTVAKKVLGFWILFIVNELHSISQENLGSWWASGSELWPPNPRVLG